MTNSIRKPYPGREERIQAVDAKIARLEKLNAEREVLITLTGQKVAARKAALAKSREALENAIAHREKLIALENRPKTYGIAGARRAEKAAFAELKEKLAVQGKTLNDLLESL